MAPGPRSGSGTRPHRSPAAEHRSATGCRGADRSPLAGLSSLFVDRNADERLARVLALGVAPTADADAEDVGEDADLHAIAVVDFECHCWAPSLSLLVICSSSSSSAAHAGGMPRSLSSWLFPRPHAVSPRAARPCRQRAGSAGHRSRSRPGAMSTQARPGRLAALPRLACTGG